MPLQWSGEPTDWHADDDRLAVTAGARTDWFVDPADPAQAKANAPALLGPASGDYLLGTRVKVAFAAVYDAGVLMLHVDDRTWAKLCFEYSPQQEPTIVSVVTDGTSDDANAFAVERNEVWLRIAHIGSAFAFHASVDGSTWRLIRYFALAGAREPSVGFVAQSPTGEGCTVTFDEIRFEQRRLADLRSGE